MVMKEKLEVSNPCYSPFLIIWLGYSNVIQGLAYSIVYPDMSDQALAGSIAFFSFLLILSHVSFFFPSLGTRVFPSTIDVQRKKSFLSKEASFMSLESSWLPLSEYLNHRRWKTNR